MELLSLSEEQRCMETTMKSTLKYCCFIFFSAFDLSCYLEYILIFLLGYQLKSKEDPEQIKQVMGWLQQAAGHPLKDSTNLYEALRDGVVLCEFVSNFHPHSLTLKNCQQDTAWDYSSL